MQFWDSSALLPLVVRQPPFSAPCRRAFRTNLPRAMAFLARIECRSAVERLAREGKLKATARRRVLAKLDKLLAAFDVVAFSAEVEMDAVALLGSHPLRTLDALQLSCARRLKGDGVAEVELVCCDRKLAEAAAAEGFPLVIAL